MTIDDSPDVEQPHEPTTEEDPLWHVIYSLFEILIIFIMGV